MSTLWTPQGERPIRPEPGGDRPEPATTAGTAPGGAAEELTPEELAAQVAELRDQLAQTPAVVVVANHGYGLFELAALHLSQKPPQLDQAQLAIDALGALVEGLAGRLGEHEAQLKDGLAQLRLAYVQSRAGASAGNGPDRG
jgi:ribosomal protein L29